MSLLTPCYINKRFFLLLRVKRVWGALHITIAVRSLTIMSVWNNDCLRRMLSFRTYAVDYCQEHVAIIDELFVLSHWRFVNRQIQVRTLMYFDVSTWAYCRKGRYTCQQCFVSRGMMCICYMPRFCVQGRILLKGWMRNGAYCWQGIGLLLLQKYKLTKWTSLICQQDSPKAVFCKRAAKSKFKKNLSSDNCRSCNLLATYNQSLGSFSILEWLITEIDHKRTVQCLYFY